MKKKPIRKKYFQSSLFHIFCTALSFALVILIFYLFNEGFWQDIILFCTHFFEIKWLENFIASYGKYANLTFVAVQAVQVIIPFIPGDVTGFVGGYLFGNTMGIILSTIGLSLGSLVAFYIAKIFGLGLVEKIVKKQYKDRIDYWITHRGLYLMFILFLIPGFPKDSLCYLLGLSRLKVVHFILMNVFGRLPGTVLLTMQGTAVDNKEYAAFFVLLAGALIITLVLYILRKYCTKTIDSIIRRLPRAGREPSTYDSGPPL